MKKRNHIATWLSNMSVATFVLGAFQTITPLPHLGDKTKWVVMGIAFIEFLASLILIKED